MLNTHYPDNTWFMAKYIVITIVFLALIYFISRYLIQQKRRLGKGDIVLAEMIRLGTDSFVYVIEAFGKRYLIAQNKNAITLLDVQACSEESRFAFDGENSDFSGSSDDSHAEGQRSSGSLSVDEAGRRSFSELLARVKDTLKRK